MSADLSIPDSRVRFGGADAPAPRIPISVDVAVPTEARPGALPAGQPAPSPLAVEVADRYAKALTLDVELPAPPAPRAPRRSRAAMRDRALRPTAGAADRPRRSPASGSPVSGSAAPEAGRPGSAPRSGQRRGQPAPARPAPRRPQPPGASEPRLAAAPAGRADARRPRATVAPPPSGPAPEPSQARGTASVPRTSSAAPARASVAARTPSVNRAPSAAPALSPAASPAARPVPARSFAEPVDGVPARRTVTIRGRGAERDLGWPGYESRRRPALPAHERPGFHPDRAAMWAVFLGLVLVLVAATSSHAAVLTHAVR